MVHPAVAVSARATSAPAIVVRVIAITSSIIFISKPTPELVQAVERRHLVALASVDS